MTPTTIIVIEKNWFSV